MATNAQMQGPGEWAASDVLCLRVLIANVCLVGVAGTGDWVLIDAGLSQTADRIVNAAETHFGPGHPPKAIVLTHGHFDHIGALDGLLRHWDVPVYAHPLEMPYLTGRADYPSPDPTVGGGLMAWISPLYPRSGIDLGNRVRPLAQGGGVPELPGWRWLHTPGHTPGHISLFREADRVLIAGDAFTTVKQESALAVLMQEQQVHRPPAYFTMDWTDAKRSVQRLAALDPAVVAAGHGPPMKGEALAQQLSELALHFDELAVPEHGRYVEHPAGTLGKDSPGPYAEP